jgi:hypothetical protein
MAYPGCLAGVIRRERNPGSAATAEPAVTGAVAKKSPFSWTPRRLVEN